MPIADQEKDILKPPVSAHVNCTVDMGIDMGIRWKCSSNKD